MITQPRFTLECDCLDCSYHWSLNELQTLREYYPNEGALGAARHLPGRTPQAIRRKAQELGLHFQTEKNTWTEYELTVLAMHYGTRGPAYCKSRLSRWSIKAIMLKATEMELLPPMDNLSTGRRQHA